MSVRQWKRPEMRSIVSQLQITAGIETGNATYFFFSGVCVNQGYYNFAFLNCFYYDSIFEFSVNFSLV